MNIANAIPLVDLPQPSWLQRYWTKARLRHCPVFVRTCRLITQTADSTVLYRVTYLTPRSDFSDSERQAEKVVSALIESNVLCSTRIEEAQWRRGRVVTHQTLHIENDDMLRAIYSLRALKHRELVVYERLEQPDSNISPTVKDQAVRQSSSQVA